MSVTGSFDTDGNGYVDQTAFDLLGGDGVTDTWATDHGGDTYAEEVARDTTGDGRPDTWIVDHDQDGLLDRIMLDTNRDGIADSVVAGTMLDPTPGSYVPVSGAPGSAPSGGTGGGGMSLGPSFTDVLPDSTPDESPYGGWGNADGDSQPDALDQNPTLSEPYEGAD